MMLVFLILSCQLILFARSDNTADMDAKIRDTMEKAKEGLSPDCRSQVDLSPTTLSSECETEYHDMLQSIVGNSINDYFLMQRLSTTL